MVSFTTFDNHAPTAVPTIDHPVAEEQSIPEKIALYGIKSAVQLPVNFGVIYGSLWAVEKSVNLTSAVVGGIYSATKSVLGNAYCTVATCAPETINTVVEVALNATGAADPTEIAKNAVANRWMTKGDISMLAAMSLPIRPVANHCFKQLLGCKEDTPLRNAAAIVATSLTTTALASYATNLLGFETDTAWLLKNNIIGVALVPALLFTAAKLQQMIDEDDELLATEDEAEILEVPAESKELDPTRVTDLSVSVLVKVDVVSKDVFQPV